MEHLISLDVGPPGGWRVVEPTTGYWATGVTFQSMVAKMAQHHLNMNIPPDPEWRLSEILEDRLCKSLSDTDRLAYCKTGVRQRSAVGWREVMQFLAAVVEWLKGGMQLVDQVEAERRAAICITCPLNVGMGGCAPCKVTVDAARIALTTAMQRSTSQDAGLRNCGVCGCENKVTVHLPLDVLRVGKEHLTFPDFCWQANTSSQ